SDLSKSLVPAQRGNVFRAAGDQVIHADHLGRALGDQAFTQVGTDEPRPPQYRDPLTFKRRHQPYLVFISSKVTWPTGRDLYRSCARASPFPVPALNKSSGSAVI